MRWMCVFALAIGALAQEVQLAEIASGLARPTDIQQPDDGSGRLFVLEQAGYVRVIRGGAPQLVMDITDRVTRINAGGDERGLLGMAFPPSFKTKQYFYLNYTNRNGATTISRFRMTGADADTADPASEQILLTVSQPFTNHNGGQLQFGPDGFLYIGMGDGGSANDPQRNAQSPQSMLGKMLRIDVESNLSAYNVPSTNPFRNNLLYRPEIWATGLRNPWRFSFDSATGNLWIGDVGQDRTEEIDLQLKSSSGGENYGWNVMEGSACLIAPCTQIGVRPIFEYPHSNGNISITGGYVYRGSISPSLRGLYIYADYSSGRIWTLSEDNGRWTTQLLIRPANFTASTFGQDRNGEVYVADYSAGKIYRIEVTGPPRLTSSSVVNGASFVAGMTPGSAATAFVSGAKYNAGVTAADSLPLPTALEDIAVLVNDTPAPLYAVANVGGVEQINFQVPFELAGVTSARVAVRRGSSTGSSVDVPVFDAQPAVFTLDGTLAIVVHAGDNTLVTADSPLQPGENVYLYATGLGAVDVTPPTGAATPNSPLANTKTRPTVTIGGKACSVLFAGLAPELAGVYQVNLTIPINIPSGEQDLVITTGSKPSPAVRVSAR
ncbi:MAG: PQQ-dependent sugar dehydrogenase [Acidobacteriota bacterium]